MTGVTKILIELQYLPPIQYFSKFLLDKEIIIEQQESYVKGSYRNRCHLAGPNGLARLSIPLRKGKNQRQGIRDVRIAYEEPWPSQHWQSIQTAYGNAPFFEYYVDDIKVLFEERPEFLFDWNVLLLEKLLENIGLSKPLQFSTQFQKECSEDTFDMRNSIFPKKHRQKEDPFFTNRSYAQVFQERHGFLSNLSILDLLFCTGPQSIIYLEEMIPKEA